MVKRKVMDDVKQHQCSLDLRVKTETNLTIEENFQAIDISQSNERPDIHDF